MFNFMILLTKFFNKAALIAFCIAFQVFIAINSYAQDMNDAPKPKSLGDFFSAPWAQEAIENEKNQNSSNSNNSVRNNETGNQSGNVNNIRFKPSNNQPNQQAQNNNQDSSQNSSQNSSGEGESWWGTVNNWLGVDAEPSKQNPSQQGGASSRNVSPQKTEQQRLNEELIYRISFGNPKDIILLLEQGANPNSLNEKGWPALNLAIMRNDGGTAPMVAALVEAGANLDLLAPDERTALMHAIEYDQSEVARFLVDRGADYYSRNSQGLSAIDIAKDSDNKKILEMFAWLEKKAVERREQSQSVDRANRAVTKFAFYSCAHQYMKFYIDSGMATIKEQQNYQQQRPQQEKRLNGLYNRLINHYKIDKEAVKLIGDVSAQQIYDELFGMVSNQNRFNLGVGTEDDMIKRCTEKANHWQVKEDGKEGA